MGRVPAPNVRIFSAKEDSVAHDRLLILVIIAYLFVILSGRTSRAHIVEHSKSIMFPWQNILDDHQVSEDASVQSAMRALIF